ncbi:MAG: phage/plasmid primase, P4 family [Clostridia bacterium]|nr:phage/plasmid primase, P4 family [Clostridia bacterium]
MSYEITKNSNMEIFKEIDQEIEQEKLEEVISSYFDKSDLAEQIWKRHPYFYDTSRIWWLWNLEEKRWEVVDDTEILVMVKNASRANTIAAKEKSEIIEAMKQYGREQKPKDIKKTWIQFKNKIYDYLTGEKFEVTPEYFVTNPIPYEINGDDKTPIMDKIFEEWVGKKNVKKLYEILAYCLVPDYPIHRIFCFIGAGMNGKSKFLDLLRKFIGKSNCCSTELDRLLISRFEVTRLHKKLVCQMGETDFNEIGKTSTLKQLSGGDLIGFEYKNKDPFDEVNYAKILIATNNLPATNDKTIGFYRRWMIIDFPNQFSEAKDILADIPEEEYKNLATKCLGILKELIERRSFTNEGSIEERMMSYEDHSNPISKFLKENCSIGNGGDYVTKNSFENKLNDWLEKNKYRKMTTNSIFKWMTHNGYEEGREYINWFGEGKIDKKLARVWYGLRFLDQK